MGLHYGDPQIALGIVFAGIALLLAVAFTVIGLQAGSDVSVERVHRVGYWLRKRWLAFLVMLGVLVFGISLFDLPYPSRAAGGRTVVDRLRTMSVWRRATAVLANADQFERRTRHQHLTRNPLAA
jgi:hypothetical protein